ncbi:MAG: 16S rRNA (guanine(966)-N(2))-methyltransferase RsmD [Bacillota bacterium]
MRVIAGEAGGRKIKSIKGTPTRPTLDRIKEAIFNIIAPYIFADKGLDLFAGFGGLGIEALSRGIESMVFVENNYRNCRVIKENLDITGFADRGIIEKEDVFDYLKSSSELYGLVFMDPPYNQDYVERVLTLLSENQCIKDNAIIVAEHEVDYKYKVIKGIELIKQKQYGDTGISIFTKGGSL